MEASAWLETKPEEGYNYRLQINNISSSNLKKVERVCSSWRTAGYGWNPDTKDKILIYAKKFNTKREWLNWAKQFPFKLVELNSKGDPKPVRLGVHHSQKMRKRRK